MRPVMESAWLSSNFPGQDVCGDCQFAETIRIGALIVVADGLGHGSRAADACHAGMQEARRSAANLEALTEVVRECDKALRRTRGAAMAFCVVDRQADTLTWLGIGNVEGRLLSPREDGSYSQQSLLMRSGVVGYNLPELRPTRLPLRRGDVLILATDGIRPDFASSVPVNQPVVEICKFIMSRYAKKNDDSLVLAARYRG